MRRMLAPQRSIVSCSSFTRLARVVSLLALALAGCSKAAASVHTTREEPSAAVAVPSPPAAAAAIVGKDDIAGLFRAEAHQRPAGGVRVEGVLAAFERSGVEISAVRQHLAKPFGAEYCAGAEATHGIAISICEYASADAAATGRAASAKGLATIPNREVVLNGATTLTLRDRENSAESRAVAERLKRSFAALKT